MRKHLKRTLAMLLAVVMVLAMLPTAFAADGFAITKLDGIPGDNQTVVIYSDAAKAVLGGTADGGTIPSAAVKDNTVTTGAGAYKLIKNSDGTYYITNGGRYLTTDSSEDFTFESAPKTGSKWDLVPSAQADYPGYLIKNHEVKYNTTGDIYIEYYGSTFSGYTLQSDNYNIFVYNFYSVADGADTDGDGYIGGTRPAPGGNLPVEGDQVVVYSPYAKMCFGIPEDDTGLTGVESTLTGSSLEAGNGALIFTVHVSGNYYTFANTYVDETGKTGTRYLRASENPTESGAVNPENIYFDTTESNYTQWRLEPVTGGFIMYNREAKYKGSSVCIEYFSNMFSGWTYNGSANLFAMQFFKVEDTHNTGFVVNPKANITAKDAQMGVDYNFIVELDDLTEITALNVTYTVNGGSAVKIEGVADENDPHKFTYTVPKAALEGKTSLTLNVSATNEYNMTYTSTANVPILDEPYIVSVMPSANTGTESEKRPEIGAVIANCGTNPTVEMTINGEKVTPTVTADRISYKASEDMPDTKYNVSLKITRTDGKSTEMSWSFFVGKVGLSAYFGQLHSHTAEYSDGAGQLEAAYEYAMNTAKDVDFLIVTDHSNYFDTTTTATTTSYYDLSSLTKGNTKSKWEEAKETAAYYDALSTDFVAAYGYEMTWSGGPGHTNTFNTYGVVSRNNSSLNEKSNSYAGMHLYNDLMVNANDGLDVDGNPVAEGVKTKWIEEAPVVSQFNHPGVTFGTFDDFAGYTPARDVILNLVEVGNGEGLVGGSSYFPSYSEYDKALGKGWHIAPTNNQDNHKGRWGDSNTCRDVILTENFTEVGLYEAIAERRVYSTEDQNLLIYYYLNDHLMGDIIDTEGEEVDKVHITASISDPDREAIGKIEVIGESGATVKTVDNITGSTYELDLTLDNTQAYYYLKVTQADGDIAVTAPVWVGAATPIAATIKTDAILSIVGEEETITVSVDNQAEGDFTLNRIELSLNAGDKETLVKTIDKTGTVLKFGEKLTEEIKYIRTVGGTQDLEVTFIGTYNGKEFKAVATLTNKVYLPSELVNVAVDYGHDNYYITGDYANNAGNFLDFCAQNGVRGVAIQKGEFTYENLSQYDLLVLTVNYRRNAAKAVDYTEQEIADLAKFVQNGGSVIICSKSDRDNTFDNCSENTNKLLEAIGAHTRMVNGIIVDNELKANEAYRVYFSSKDNINSEHRFTKGIYTASNAFGTTPSPSNETGFQVYNGGPVEILEGYEDKVEVLIKGYDTTWGSHYDGYFTGGSFVPEYDENDPSKVTVKMGDVNVMTYEDTPAGGWILTSGVTFFSNYDIKSDQDYANRFLLQNILLDLTGGDGEITPISTVKQKTEGEYTIEGYVTSNASAYDQDTAFFDCIYVQDKNGNGINVFPVAGNYAIGMNVRCHGGVTFYCGEIELNLSTDYDGSIRVISDDLVVLPPKEVTAATAMSDAAIGNLMSVKGIVTRIHKTEGVIDKIYVRDGTGVACLFINGYINSDDHTLDNTLKIGMIVSGVGIGSRDVDETSTNNEIFSRLRVRTRSEIKILDSKVDYVKLFPDISKNEWYYDAVCYAIENELMNGTGDYTFEPNTTLTRAMVATILYRMAGEPLGAGKATFTDVPEGMWYTDAVAWAEDTGVVKGVGDGTFHPDDVITREQMMTMLARYAKTVNGKDTTPTGDLKAFSDAGTVSSWAVNDVTWCVENAIVKGDGTGKLLPLNTATRAEFAQIVMGLGKIDE